MLSPAFGKLAFMDANTELDEDPGFGARLAAALEAAKKTRRELADHLLISVQAVGQAINGGRFSAANAAKAARFLGVNWYWLATGEESPAPTEGVHLTDKERDVLHKVLQDSQVASPVVVTAKKRKGGGGSALRKRSSQKAKQPRKRKDDDAPGA